MDQGLLRFLNGDPNRLDGRLVAIAKLDPPLAENHGGAAMVHNDLLVVQGNYRDQKTMADFFRTEFGLSMERGIEEMIDQARENGGLEGALDPEQVREKLRSMGDSEFLPIPAKVIRLDSLEAASNLPGDVIYLGTFAEFQFAHMAVNALPILYQARFREQERERMHVEIEQMLEKLVLLEPEEAAPDLNTFEGDVENHLLREILPGMLYASEASPEAIHAEKRFRQFMAPHMYPQDVEAMVSLVPSVREGKNQALHHLELLVRKAVALQKENWKQLETLRKELGEFDPPAG